MIPKINSAHGSDTRNIINRAIDLINFQGKSIQDLVAEGQLTPAQYAQLVSIVNGNVKKGSITADDLDKNNFQLNQTHLSDELLQQMAGNTPINATPADGSLTTKKYADKSVTLDKVDFSREVAKLAENIIVNGNFIDSDGDGTADGWLINPNSTSPRVENNTQYWMPLGTENSAAVASHSSGWSEEGIAGHKYYVAFEQTNVKALRIISDPNYETPLISEDGRYSMVYTPPIDGVFDFRFLPRTANVESSIKNVLVVDLTETFGVGKEPNIEYFEFLLKILGAGGWFGGTLNLTDSTKNGVVTAKDLNVYDPNKIIDAENVNDALFELEKNSESNLSNLVKNSDFSNGTTGWEQLNSVLDVKSGRLRVTPEDFNPDSAFGVGSPIEMLEGDVYYIKIGYYKQTGIAYQPIVLSARIGDDPSTGLGFSIHQFDNNEGVQSVSTVITPSTDVKTIAFRGFATEGFHYFDIDKILAINLTKTFGAGNEPTGKEIDELLSFIPEKWFDGSLKNKEFINAVYLNSIKKKPEGGGSDGSGVAELELLYELSMSNLEKDRLNENLTFLNGNAQSAVGLKHKEVSDTQTIPLKNTGEQKMILHLHKRENEGYDTDNDVYLPNAESDFSDIKITNEDGAVLPYRVTHYSDEYDILVDSRLGYGFPTSLILTDSLGNWYRVFDQISVSEDEGKSWSEIPALSEFTRPVANLITSNDTLLFNHDGILYRSEAPYTSYTQVLDLDPTGTHTTANVVGKGVVQHPDGELFLGAYQAEWDIKIYKSTDDGATWEVSADWGDEYQHVHGMFVDTYSNPVAVYAGLDGGGGVLKTTDKGASWVDLRAENPDMPQSTDYGVRYADPSGYRFLGGETPVVGGHSIIKTDDDVNFRPVLSTGISVNYVIKMGGKLFATGSGTSSHDVGQVLVSEDEGETWKTAYITTPYTIGTSVNDGYRYMTDLGNQILVGAQGGSIPYLRIFPEGKYAEVVVDVPAGSNSIIIESGYAYTNIQPIYNDTKNINDYLVNFNLNEGGGVIKETVSDKYFEGNFEWEKVGRHLSHFYPYISSPNDRQSVLLRSLNGYNVDSSRFDVSDGITISFWMRMDESVELEVFKTDLGDVFSIDRSSAGLRTTLNGSYKAQFMRYILPDAFIKVDLTIDASGEAAAYNNGHPISVRKYNSFDVLEAIQNSSEMTLLNTISSRDSHCIQHFSIRKGVVSEEQLLAEYNSYISNNLF